MRCEFAKYSKNAAISIERRPITIKNRKTHKTNTYSLFFSIFDVRVPAMRHLRENKSKSLFCATIGSRTMLGTLVTAFSRRAPTKGHLHSHWEKQPKRPSATHWQAFTLFIHRKKRKNWGEVKIKQKIKRQTAHFVAICRQFVFGATQTFSYRHATRKKQRKPQTNAVWQSRKHKESNSK